MIRAPLVTALLGTLGAVGAAAAEPPPIVVPSGFRIEIVADGLGGQQAGHSDAAVEHRQRGRGLRATAANPD